MRSDALRVSRVSSLALALHQPILGALFPLSPMIKLTEAGEADLAEMRRGAAAKEALAPRTNPAIAGALAQQGDVVGSSVSDTHGYFDDLWSRWGERGSD